MKVNGSAVFYVFVGDFVKFVAVMNVWVNVFAILMVLVHVKIWGSIINVSRWIGFKVSNYIYLMTHLDKISYFVMIMIHPWKHTVQNRDGHQED